MNTTSNYFKGKDFADVQKALELDSEIRRGKSHIDDMEKQKSEIMEATFVEDNGCSLIDERLAKFRNADELAVYLNGPILSDRVMQRINEFFDAGDGKMLTLKKDAAKKLDIDQASKKHIKKDLEFKKEILLYFKKMNDAIDGITKEQEKLEKAHQEFDKGMAEALNPLKDNILAYAAHLEEEAKAMSPLNYKNKKLKDQKLQKAYYIRCGYTLENLIELVRDNKKVRDNAMRDFHNDARLVDLGRRYQEKLNQGKINLTLYPLIGNRPEDSLEFKLLPMDDYPAGLEGFTAVFLIRYLERELPSVNGQIFQASVYTALQRALEGTLDKEVLDTIKRGMKEFLSYFA